MGREVRVCPTCKREFPHADALTGHICSLDAATADCNLALFFYFYQLDLNRGITQPHVRLSFSDYLVRLHRETPRQSLPPLPPVDLYPAAGGLIHRTTPDFVEDPLSSRLRLDYDPYTDSVSVHFVKDLPCRSFRSRSAFGSSEWAAGDCFFCKLRDKPFAASGGGGGDSRLAADRLLIHLAEEHFGAQLHRMFGSPHREGWFRQGETPCYVFHRYLFYCHCRVPVPVHQIQVGTYRTYRYI
jgi:hypothetical protein